MNRALVLGTEIDRISLSEAIELALRYMEQRRGVYLVTPNTEIVLKAQRSSALRGAIREAALSLPDSVGVLLAATILGEKLPGRIPGIDFAQALMTEMGSKGKSVFLFGAREGVAVRAAENLKRDYPGLRIAGTASGYLSPETEEALAKTISAASPDLLLVCLGTPKQELWMRRYAGQIRVGLMAGLGGTLDVLAGDVPRAPQGWRKCGLEWFFRLICEPKRFMRVVRLPRIVLAALRSRIGG